MVQQPATGSLGSLAWSTRVYPGDCGMMAGAGSAAQGGWAGLGWFIQVGATPPELVQPAGVHPLDGLSKGVTPAQPRAIRITRMSSPSSLGFRVRVEAARPEAATDNSPTRTGVRRRGG
ncbi:MAG: hypothetical protein QW074_03430 [Candidatus Caldarchaeum sp.]